MTSSLRNSLHRRNHKERSQLAHRSKLGFLEKHKDYVQRAKDYHSKQDRLTRLRQKAAERNKDEFYFSMNKEKTKRGVHVKDRGNTALPTDMVKLLKTQDENYVRTMQTSNLKKIDRLKRQLTDMANLVNDDSEEGLDEDEYELLQETGIISQSSKGKKRSRSVTKHVVFAESMEEANNLGRKRNEKPGSEPTPSQGTKSGEEDLGWKVPESGTKKRRKLQQTKDNQDGEWEDSKSVDEDSASSSSTDRRRKLLKELGARLVRDRQLRYTQREFEMQRLMMGKGAAKKISGVEKLGDEDDSGDDEDALDSRKGRPLKKKSKVEEATYKPRVYKWKLERKR
ncbi:u3 small nucleolar RNA-associated protein 11 [Coprinopsis marcescibilis]|uniref:U3 small nucleolar RNA-associated protein 11 n=1 Tax=Coprinopsis marcescibilis TaxID=230819 RepID=A0A5C3LDK1_COPMA|nr:u3 small nucleolar RNA-associated protein 11 [Coprinopsis marcescibilis]